MHWKVCFPHEEFTEAFLYTQFTRFESLLSNSPSFAFPAGYTFVAASLIFFGAQKHATGINIRVIVPHALALINLPGE
jgi:hypothetical protein